MNGLLPVSRSTPASSLQQGMSLIELMVAVTIALVMSLAIFSTLSNSEGRKRTLTATNDVAQVGIFSAYQLDKLLRGAGSGFSQGADITYGCQLNATRTSSGQILPFTATMAAPFTAMNATLNGRYRLAPVIIAKDATTPNISGKGSDALIIMAGSAGFGEVPTLFTATGSLAQLNLRNTVSFQANDLVLLNYTTSATSTPPAPCMIEQVAPSFLPGVLPGVAATALPLAGSTYSADPINGNTIASYESVGMATNLGSGTATNPPSFVIVGVGDNNNLMSYDLLQMGTFNTSEAMADGIFEMHALYGVDTTGNGTVDVWIDPKTAGYDAVTLQSGTVTSVDTLRSIKAIRVGLILRTQLPEKVTASPTTSGPLVLFSDLGSALTYTRTLATAEQNFRYRTIETTIPLRNVLLLN